MPTSDAQKIANLARIARNILATTRRSDNNYAPTKLMAISKRMERLQ